MQLVLVLDPTPIGVASHPNPSEDIPKRIDLQTTVMCQLVEDHAAHEEARQLKRTYPVMKVIYFEEPPHFLEARLEREALTERRRDMPIELVVPPVPKKVATKKKKSTTRRKK